MVYRLWFSHFSRLYRESAEFEMNERNFNNKLLFTEERQREILFALL